LPILSGDSLKHKIRGHKRGGKKQKSTIFEGREELVIIKRGKSKTGLNRIDKNSLPFVIFCAVLANPSPYAAQEQNEFAPLVEKQGRNYSALLRWWTPEENP